MIYYQYKKYLKDKGYIMKITFTKAMLNEAMKHGCKTVGELNNYINEHKEIK